MKEYPEPTGRIFDYLEIVTTGALAVAVCACVYFAAYFALIMLSTPNGQDARSTTTAEQRDFRNSELGQILRGGK